MITITQNDCENKKNHDNFRDRELVIFPLFDVYQMTLNPKLKYTPIFPWIYS
jgi:hypothetical protein